MVKLEQEGMPVVVALSEHKGLVVPGSNPDHFMRPISWGHRVAALYKYWLQCADAHHHQCRKVPTDATPDIHTNNIPIEGMGCFLLSCRPGSINGLDALQHCRVKPRPRSFQEAIFKV
jgi:hypothetical protein